MEFCNSFNSKLVRLKLKSVFVTFTMTFMRFNSKLVRLKLGYAFDSPRPIYHLFQFQTGSIKTRASIISSKLLLKFQFQTGSIKTIKRAIEFLHFAILSFNSKLVRLKHNFRIFDKHRRDYVSIPNWFD